MLNRLLAVRHWQQVVVVVAVATGETEMIGDPRRGCAFGDRTDAVEVVEIERLAAAEVHADAMQCQRIPIGDMFKLSWHETATGEEVVGQQLDPWHAMLGRHQLFEMRVTQANADTRH